MLATIKLVFYALYSTTVDQPAELFLVQNGQFSSKAKFYSSDGSSWSTQLVRAGSTTQDVYVFDGNTGVNNIGNSDRIWYIADSKHEPKEVLNVTSFGCALNDLLVLSSGESFSVCGTGSGGILVFRAQAGGAAFKLVSNISMTTYDDLPTILSFGASKLVTFAQSGNIFSASISRPSQWTQLNPPFDSSLTYSIGPGACNSHSCLFFTSACLYVNHQCRSDILSFFTLSASGSWVQANATNDYELACATGDDTFFLSDGQSLYTYSASGGEVLVFSGAKSNVRIQSMVCDPTPNSRTVYLNGYSDDSSVSYIWKYDGSWSVVAKNEQNWHISSVSLPRAP